MKVAPRLSILSINVPIVFLGTAYNLSQEEVVKISWFPHDRNSGLEKSAAIRPFANKKSCLASEKILFSEQFGD